MAEYEWYVKNWKDKESKEFNKWWHKYYGNEGEYADGEAYYTRKSFALAGWLAEKEQEITSEGDGIGYSDITDEILDSIAEISVIWKSEKLKGKTNFAIRECLITLSQRLTDSFYEKENEITIERPLTDMTSVDYKIKINGMSSEIEALKEKLEEKDAEIIRLNSKIVNNELEKFKQLLTNDVGNTKNDIKSTDNLKPLLTFGYGIPLHFEASTTYAAIRTLAAEIMKLRDK